jgi:hypothetical protein
MRRRWNPRPFLLAASLLLVVAVSPGFTRAEIGTTAAPGGKSSKGPTQTNASATAAPANGARPNDKSPNDPRAAGSFAQRRRELDDMRREDVAAQLALLGVSLKWQDYTLADLIDWRDRIDAAVTLRVQFRVDVDWKVTSLRDLTDMRLRAAKASDLSGAYGVRVDWRRYSWVALESLRRQMAKLSPVRSETPLAADGLARPGFSAHYKHLGTRPKDPDAIIEPMFAFDTPLFWSRPSNRRGKSDPDAILVPTFVTVPSPPLGRDDVIDPWNGTPRR